jgi:hypothetical protein
VRIRHALVHHGRLLFIESGEPLHEGHYIIIDFDKAIEKSEHIKVAIDIEGLSIGAVDFYRRRALESICC